MSKMAQDNSNNSTTEPNHRDIPNEPCENFTSYFMGVVPPLNRWLLNKPWPLKFLNACLRGYGQPVFLNNPFSGIIIMVAMFLQNPWQGTNGLIGLVVAQLTAMLMKQDKGAVENGAIAFQGLLTGLVITAMSGTPQWYAPLILPVVICSIISVMLSSALGNLLGQWGIPAFNLPFNVATYVFVASVWSSKNAHFPIAVSPVPKSFGEEAIDWIQIVQAVPIGIGQCYGCGDLIPGCLVAAAMLLCSPVIFFHSVLSSVIGALTGLALAVPPADIYNGSWGYNSVLAGASVGGFFMVLTWSSHALALFSAIFAAVVRGSLAATLNGLPVIAFPFCISAGLFLLVTSNSKQLIRVPMDQITCPEDHWKNSDLPVIMQYKMKTQLN
ncbi:urea transporter 2-like [Amphiura filiformis]|uniref:urea transporter 2-like n=1 Tax=Amphiura filiformis TaxID=82378 RepID=UPI003B220CAF